MFPIGLQNTMIARRVRSGEDAEICGWGGWAKSTGGRPMDRMVISKLG